MWVFQNIDHITLENIKCNTENKLKNIVIGWEKSTDGKVFASYQADPN